MIFFEKIQLFYEGFTEGFKEGWHEAGAPKAVSGNSDDSGYYCNEDSYEENVGYSDILHPSHREAYPYHDVYNDSRLF